MQSLNPSGPLATSSTLWLQHLKEEGVSSNEPQRRLAAELAMHWLREWMDRQLTSSMSMGKKIGYSKLVQSLQKQVRERDRRIEELRAQLEQQDKMRKVKPPPSRGRPDHRASAIDCCLPYARKEADDDATDPLPSSTSSSLGFERQHRLARPVEEPMKPRYKERIPLNTRVFFTIGSGSAEGRLVDLTVPGCLIDNAVRVEKGQSVALNIFLPGLPSPFVVTLAAVRWTNGTQFGLEFINMEHAYVLNRFVAQYLSGAHPKPRNAFGEPGGRNWHLETYSISRKR